jgi:hypothetical protein
VSDWTYRGAPLIETGDAITWLGFIYLITNLSDGKKYVGRKLFTSAATRQIKGKKKKYRKDSGWQNYWSSSEDVKADVILFGKAMFTREILHLCETKSELTYMENWELFTRHALIRQDYYNQWLTCRVRKSNLVKTKLPVLFA